MALVVTQSVSRCPAWARTQACGGGGQVLGLLAVAWPRLAVISPFKRKVLWKLRERIPPSLASFFGDWRVEKALEEVACGRAPE